MEEIWKYIQGYDGKYQVSNIGRVKSFKDKYGNYREKILTPCKDKDGYLIVGFYKEGKRKTYRVHRLVAEAFLDNPNNYPIINHKDENPSNNNLDNLEWCNHKYNSNYGTAIQRRVENTDYKEVSRKRVANTDYKARTANTDYKARTAKIDWKKKVANTNYKEISRKTAEKISKTVLQYTKDGEFVKEWSSTRECGRNSFDQGAVSKCCRGITKSYKGFIWRYKNGES